MIRTLPQGFIEMLAGYGCPEVTDKLVEALATSDPSLAVRANTAKGMEIKAQGDSVPWLDGKAVYLDRRPNFALDPAWHQGLYYVQDASSMILTHIVKKIAAEIFGDAPLRYLDACAAPGGKSIAAAEALPAGSCLLSNEYDPRRAAVLAENMAKYGMPGSAVSQGDTSRLAALGEIFDIVAVDAPCSGEGMMRKEPEAIAQWTPQLIDSCATLQRDILANAWRALRGGGVLFYSTCTFNRREDEENLAYIIEELGGESIDLGLDSFEGVHKGFSTPYHCYRFMPGHVRGEGLFIAAVRKSGDSAGKIKAKKAAVKAPEVRRFPAAVLAAAEQYAIRQDRAGEYYAVPQSDEQFFDFLAEKLHLISCGVPLCRVKGKDLVPAWQLAFSQALAPGAFPSVVLDRAGALSYLHGDSLADIPDDLPRGFATVNYAGHPLGFIKNIGRRANNLYPDAIRLRLDPAKGIDNDYLSLL